MWRYIHSLGTISLLAAGVFLGEARSQVAPQPGSKDIPRGYQAVPTNLSGDDNAKTPAFAYFIAAICTLTVMVIVCTPTRKLPA